jgi:hypothetical protein
MRHVLVARTRSASPGTHPTIGMPSLGLQYREKNGLRASAVAVVAVEAKATAAVPTTNPATIHFRDTRCIETLRLMFAPVSLDNPGQKQVTERAEPG